MRPRVLTVPAWRAVSARRASGRWLRRAAVERRGTPGGRILRGMPRDVAPPEIVALAEARAAARRARDWTTADDLLAEIQAAGWRVVDSGTMYDLARVAPPDVVEGDVVRYGSSLSVPTRFDEAPAGVASVILVATDWPDDLARAMRARRGTRTGCHAGRRGCERPIGGPGRRPRRPGCPGTVMPPPPQRESRSCGRRPGWAGPRP